MKSLNAGQAAAVALVDEYVRCGVRFAFIAPGSRSSPIAYALADSPIELTVCLDERAAGFMALGAAKLSGIPSLVACTSGTAAANLHPAVVEARMSAVGLIVLTADRPPELRETGAGQTIDQVKLFGTDVVWFFDPGVPEARETTNPLFRSLACRSFAEATGPPGGPVHINLQFRDPLVPQQDPDGFPYSAQGRDSGAAWSKHHPPIVLPTDEAVTDAVELIMRHERGLVVAGSGAMGADVVELSRAAGWPLVAEPLSGARVPGSISCCEAILRSGFAAAHRPDAVLRIGSLSTSKVLLAHLADSTQVVVDPPGAWHDPDRTASTVIRADVARTCSRITQMLPVRHPTAWTRSWERAEKIAREVVDRTIDEFDVVSEPRVARDLAAAVPDGSLIFVASSMPVRDLDWFMAPRHGVRVMSNRGANGIDGTISTAAGAALAHGGSAFALVGDLAFLHDQNALLADRRPDLVVVVMDNDGGGIFSFLPQSESERFEQLFGTPHGTDLASISAAHGVTHRVVEDPAVLTASLTGPGKGLSVIQVKTRRDLNVQHHRRIWEAVAASLS